MDKQFLKGFIEKLNRSAFESFVQQFFREAYPQEPFEPCSDIGEGVFRRELLDSYGGSIHAIYITHSLPIELFNQPKETIFAEPALVGKLRRLRKKYKRELGQWGMVSPCLVPSKALNGVYFLNSFANITQEVSHETILPIYRKILRKNKLFPTNFGVGSSNSFLERNPEHVQGALTMAFGETGGGLCLRLDEGKLNLDRYMVQKNLSEGVSQQSKCPYEPVLVRLRKQKEELLLELETLIQRHAPEHELERFITAHYADIFGSKYENIQTQLWLKFPEHDIAGKSRRLDIFLRNSVTNDWDLFEIKRPVAELTGTYRDAPVIAHELSNAIQQVKNYGRILSQDEVKKHFADEGIEYYEPSLNLVIGRTPQIPIKEWRWLLKANEGDVRIFTFDDLLKEMQCRQQDVERLLRQLHRS